MNIDTKLTVFEGEIYEELKQKKFIRWVNTLPVETKTLNRLVKKGLAIKSVDDKNYNGWKIKDV